MSIVGSLVSDNVDVIPKMDEGDKHTVTTTIDVGTCGNGR